MTPTKTRVMRSLISARPCDEHIFFIKHLTMWKMHPFIRVSECKFLWNPGNKRRKIYFSLVVASFISEQKWKCLCVYLKWELFARAMTRSCGAGYLTVYCVQSTMRRGEERLLVMGRVNVMSHRVKHPAVNMWWCTRGHFKSRCNVKIWYLDNGSYVWS